MKRSSVSVKPDESSIVQFVDMQESRNVRMCDNLLLKDLIFTSLISTCGPCITRVSIDPKGYITLWDRKFCDHLVGL